MASPSKSGSMLLKTKELTITEKLIGKIKSLKVYLEGEITTKTQEVVVVGYGGGMIDVNHTLVYYDHRTEGSKSGC